MSFLDIDRVFLRTGPPQVFCYFAILISFRCRTWIFREWGVNLVGISPSKFHPQIDPSFAFISLKKMLCTFRTILVTKLFSSLSTPCEISSLNKCCSVCLGIACFYASKLLVIEAFSFQFNQIRHPTHLSFAFPLSLNHWRI